MLAIPLVSAMLYFFILQHMTPVDLIMDQNAEISSMINYTLALDINWMLLTTDINLLVIIFIFQDGLELKEETLLTA